MLCLATDLLVLGCGKQIQQVKPQLLDWLADHGIALECLDTVSRIHQSPLMMY